MVLLAATVILAPVRDTKSMYASLDVRVLRAMAQWNFWPNHFVSLLHKKRLLASPLFLRKLRHSKLGLFLSCFETMLRHTTGVNAAEMDVIQLSGQSLRVFVDADFVLEVIAYSCHLAFICQFQVICSANLASWWLLLPRPSLRSARCTSRGFSRFAQWLLSHSSLRK